jgi:hypothetical protein
MTLVYKKRYRGCAVRKLEKFTAVKILVPKRFNSLEAQFNLEIFKLALEDEFSDKSLQARRERQERNRQNNDPNHKP